MSSMVADADSAELQALFDNIVKDNSAKTQVAVPGAQAKAQVKAGTKAQARGQTKAKDGPKARGKAQSVAQPPDSVMSRVGQLTRTLHDALRELGYDRLLEKTAASIPDARDRLDYVVKMTEQAAVRALNATEAAQPIQNKLGADAERLSAQWQKLFERKLSVEEFKALVSGTRDYLADVPTQASATNAQLLEIMMAQDFQDLTGQVIKKITSLAQEMEQQLVHLLVDLAPAKVRGEIGAGLLNGPVVNAAAGHEVVTDQNQVDELLASLGF